MYKFLIVDDEAMEVEALSRIVTGRYGEKCSVATASNGKMAIARANEIRPDIVMMDIEMPGLNGLEAAKAIRQTLPRTRVVIVTAYERFMYAQMAIALGAEDYLLKPVNNENLFRLLDRAMAEIDADRKDKERREVIGQLIREQFVLSIISGQADSAVLRRQFDDLELPPFHYGLFCVFRGAQGEHAEVVAGAVTPFLKQWAGRESVIMEYDGQVLAMLLIEQAEDARDERIQAGIRQAAADIARDAQLQVFAGVGPAVASLEDLEESYSVATCLVKKCSPEKPVKVPSGTIARKQPHNGLEQRLYNQLLEKNIEGALRCVDLAFDAFFYVLDSADAVVDAMYRLLTQVAGRMQEDARTAGDLRPVAPPKEVRGLTQQELTVRIRGLLSEWMAAALTQPPARMHHIRAEIERYLQMHFAQDLSVKQVASEMHYSEPYFSKLFARCFQRNFVSYLTDIRMQASRDMLESSPMNVREISAAVGFTDANYFAKVFRKTYGVSPSEYRRFATARPEEAP